MILLIVVLVVAAVSLGAWAASTTVEARTGTRRSLRAIDDYQVVDVRDLAAMQAVGLPLYSRGTTPVSFGELHVMADLSVPISCAGVLIMLGVGARQAMSARYERRARTQPAANQGPTDQGDWWKALDAGDDPTGDDPTAVNPGSVDAASTPDGGSGTPPAVSEHTSGDGYHDPNASRPS